jgi:hypothetical protein
MKRKAPKDSPTEVAAAAGCSKGLAHRLLARGMTREAIIQRVSETKARKAALAAVPKNSFEQEPAPSYSNGANGHAASHPALIGIPSFIESQTLKEFHLASLRGIEVQSKRRDLLPIGPLLSVCLSGIAFMKQRLMALPDELGVDFGRTLAKVLQQRLEYIFSEARRVHEQECLKNGIVLPPEPPPAPMPPQLPYYQRYERGSTTGEVENATAREQIGTPEWLALHPSITFQESFKISAKKKEWDRAMAELLNTRNTWDIPPEAPTMAPEPEAA